MTRPQKAALAALIAAGAIAPGSADASDKCVASAKFATVAMTWRQEGVPVTDAVDLLNAAVGSDTSTAASGKALATSMLSVAYTHPVQRGKKLKSEAIKEFSAIVFTECMSKSR